MFDGTRPKNRFLPRTFQPSRSVKHGLAKLLIFYLQLIFYVTTRDRPLSKPHGPWPPGVGGPWNPKNRDFEPCLEPPKSQVNILQKQFLSVSDKIFIGNDSPIEFFKSSSNRVWLTGRLFKKFFFYFSRFFSWSFCENKIFGVLRPPSIVSRGKTETRIETDCYCRLRTTRKIQREMTWGKEETVSCQEREKT